MVKVLTAKSDALSSSPGDPGGWKETNNSQKLSSDLHIHTCVHAHIMHTHTINNVILKIKD